MSADKYLRAYFRAKWRLLFIYDDDVRPELLRSYKVLVLLNELGHRPF